MDSFIAFLLFWIELFFFISSFIFNNTFSLFVSQYSFTIPNKLCKLLLFKFVLILFLLAVISFWLKCLNKVFSINEILSLLFFNWLLFR